MCDYQSMLLIDDVVGEWTDQSRAFTAFEVSLEVQKRGSKERHRDMRQTIHDAMQNYIRNAVASNGEVDDYKQTEGVHVGDENGQRLEAILYHPSHYDVSRYVPLPRLANRNTSIADPTRLAAPVPSITVVNAIAAPAKPGVKEVDKRSTLLIPCQLLKDANIKPSEKVYVCTDKGLVVVTTDPGARVTIGEYTVDSHNNVRITQHVLAKAGIAGTQYTVVSSGVNEVGISLA